MPSLANTTTTTTSTTASTGASAGTSTGANTTTTTTASTTATSTIPLSSMLLPHELSLVSHPEPFIVPALYPRRQCTYCHRPLPPSHPRVAIMRKFCSHSCRQLAYLARQKFGPHSRQHRPAIPT